MAAILFHRNRTPLGTIEGLNRSEILGPKSGIPTMVDIRHTQSVRADAPRPSDEDKLRGNNPDRMTRAIYLLPGITRNFQG